MGLQIVESDRMPLIPLYLTSVCSAALILTFTVGPPFQNSSIVRISTSLGSNQKLVEGKRGTQLSENGNLGSKNRQKTSQLRKRVAFGLGIGISVGGVVLAGGWFFTVALAASVFVGTGEYFELVGSHGVASGMTPHPRYVPQACSVIFA